MYYFNIFILILFIMVGVAFFVLLERSILGYIQLRKGPNKVGFLGIFQPFSDAIKLFTSENMIPYMSNFIIYFFSPVFSLALSLFLWLVFPFLFNLMDFIYGVLFFICCTSMGVYSVMISGWSSCSIYSLLGSLRSVAQTISYEVSLSLILLSFIFLIDSYNFVDFYYYQINIWFFFLSMPLSFCWFSSSLAETNRSPFDFAEGESELVSGFNVEYSGGGFSFIFLSEYSSIIFMSVLYIIIFFGCNLSSYTFFLKSMFICFLFIWVRGTMPRYRYDKLMYMAWKSYLPVSLNYFIFFLGFKCLII
uniref:NADH-ubiquinone oxidoreductase chain 1 n=1 Tax=Phymatostetha huangshanensis (nomen nudum) TaxID=2291524 RepID=A0A345UDI2_9HEMI|nr:NADH dehydrogenase subunit 1 [Phymatostetha huangshanensis (nomen nudum)]AXI98518.1 NADH dehydrogenase subunit 1 [Phymatostetha huangshanensis (nomen nudum)]